MNSVILIQQESLAVIVEQFCKSVAVDNKVNRGKKVVGIADGKYKVPDDLSVYDEEFILRFRKVGK